MATKRQLSGIQKQVLSLYRGFLRAARSKAPEERRKIEEVVSTEFRHNSTAIDKKNFLYIEYLIRRGKRQLDQLKNPGTVGLSSLKGERPNARPTITRSHKLVHLQQPASKLQHLIPNQKPPPRKAGKATNVKLHTNGLLT